MLKYETTEGLDGPRFFIKTEDESGIYVLSLSLDLDPDGTVQTFHFEDEKLNESCFELVIARLTSEVEKYGAKLAKTMVSIVEREVRTGKVVWLSIEKGCNHQKLLKRMAKTFINPDIKYFALTLDGGMYYFFFDEHHYDHFQLLQEVVSVFHRDYGLIFEIELYLS